MANVLAKDGVGNVVELAASGTGANGDPFVRKQEVTKLPLPPGAATEASIIAGIGKPDDAMAESNVAPASGISLFKRLLVLITTLIGLFPGALAASGGFKVDGSGATQPVSAQSLPLPKDASRQVDVEAVRDRLPTTVGAKNAAASLSVTLAPDGALVSAIGSGAATSATTDTDNASSLIGFIKRLLSVKLPSSLGAKSMAEAFPVTLSPDGALVSAIGSNADPSATTDTGTASLLSLTKRLSERLSTLIGLLPTALTATGNFKVEGNVNARLFDSAGNAISTNLANTRRSLDVGINVGGTLVDPRVAVAPATIRRQGISIATSGDNPIVTAVAGQRVKVLGLFLIAAGDVSVIVKSGAGNLTGILPLASRGNGFVLPQTINGYHWLDGSVGENLAINLSAAVAVSGIVLFVQEA